MEFAFKGFNQVKFQIGYGSNLRDKSSKDSRWECNK